MKVLTRDFGEVEINSDDIIHFEQKIFGFEDYDNFIILYDDDFSGEFAWLQSVEEANLCFIITKPELTVMNYKPEIINKNIEALLGNGTYEKWLIMVTSENIKDSTVNQKSPIIVNLNNNKAAQIILEEDYPIRYRLFDAGKESK